MSHTLTDEEFKMYERAFSLLEDAFGDYHNFGEVWQDVTAEKVQEFFDEIDDVDNIQFTDSDGRVIEV